MTASTEYFLELIWRLITGETVHTPWGDRKGITVGTIEPGENHIGSVGGNTIISRMEKARPTNTTAYAQHDVICESISTPTPFIFENAFRSGATSGYIIGAGLLTNNINAVIQTRIHFFKALPTSPNDNDPLNISYTNLSNYLGYNLYLNC